MESQILQMSLGARKPKNRGNNMFLVEIYLNRGNNMFLFEIYLNRGNNMFLFEIYLHRGNNYMFLIEIYLNRGNNMFLFEIYLNRGNNYMFLVEIYFQSRFMKHVIVHYKSNCLIAMNFQFAIFHQTATTDYMTIYKIRTPFLYNYIDRDLFLFPSFRSSNW